MTIYEKQKNLGGILKRGIPEFRLPNEIVEKTIEQILALGINVQCEKELGKNLELADIEKEYDAIYLSIGANIPRTMAIEGEELEGVYGGNALLENANHPDYTNKKVAIIGGGNVAMDCARTIKRMGAKQVVVIYRRSETEMPAETKEIEDAKQEGVEFLFLNNIVKILGKDKVEQIECIKTELVQKEGETRKSPINIENSNYIMNMDYVVMAGGGKKKKNYKNYTTEPENPEAKNTDYSKIRNGAYYGEYYNYDVIYDDGKPVCVITKYNPMSTEKKLEIPAHIDGLDVISIADDAINYGGAKETVVPNTVKFIADNAFKESYSLEDIYLTKNVSYIGKSAFKDSKDLTIHAPTDSYAHTFATENKINFKATDD